MEKAQVKASDVSVAAVNGPKMTVISGRKEVVQKVGNRITEMSFFGSRVFGDEKKLDFLEKINESITL